MEANGDRSILETANGWGTHLGGVGLIRFGGMTLRVFQVANVAIYAGGGKQLIPVGQLDASFGICNSEIEFPRG